MSFSDLLVVVLVDWLARGILEIEENDRDIKRYKYSLKIQDVRPHLRATR